MKGMKAATMLYRGGHKVRLHGVHVETTIVDEGEVEDYLAQGWYRTPTEVKQAADAEAAAKAAQAAEPAEADAAAKATAGADAAAKVAKAPAVAKPASSEQK